MAGSASKGRSVVVTGPLARFAEAYKAELCERGYTPLTTVNEPGRCAAQPRGA
jgi:hypothetical protein